MVRAILDGRKTQTRRAVKPQPQCSATLGFLIQQPAGKGSCAHFHHVDGSGIHSKELTVRCPYGQPGDQLWVREVWTPLFEEDTGFCGVAYAAGGMAEEDKRAGEYLDGTDHWRPSIHMPRWASRITLEVVSVRVERLNEISESDAIAEGVFFVPGEGMIQGHYLGGIYPRKGVRRTFPVPTQAYRSLWESINGPGSWAENPWVWVVEFRRV
jgi:hypothetical protein